MGIANKQNQITSKSLDEWHAKLDGAQQMATATTAAFEKLFAQTMQVHRNAIVANVMNPTPMLTSLRSGASSVQDPLKCITSADSVPSETTVRAYRFAPTTIEAAISASPYTQVASRLKNGSDLNTTCLPKPIHGSVILSTLDVLHKLRKRFNEGVGIAGTGSNDPTFEVTLDEYNHLKRAVNETGYARFGPGTVGTEPLNFRGCRLCVVKRVGGTGYETMQWISGYDRLDTSDAGSTQT